MKPFRLILLFSVLLPVLYTGAAHAAEGDDQRVAEEITGLYSAFCLEAFPDETAVATLADGSHATEIPPQELKRYLKEDPGRGWYLNLPSGFYVITFERPPFKACAVRRMTPSGIPTVKGYIAALHAYADARKGRIGKASSQKTKTASGIDIVAFATPMAGPDGKPSDIFTVILSNYHGHAPEEWKADAAGGAGVEVRMVHLLTGPAAQAR